MATKLSLTATVTHRPGTTAKCYTVSDVTIKLGTEVAATGTLGGAFNAHQALAEFKRNPKDKRFIAGPAFATALVAV